MGNRFAKNKLPGCFKLREDQGTVFFNQRNPIFSHYVNWVALIPQSWTGGLPALAPRGLGPWCWACSPAVARGWKLEGPLGLWAFIPPTPCMPAAYHQGVFVSMERGLREAAGHGPQPRCSRVGQLLMGVPGEVEGLDHINLVSFILLLCFSPPKRNITVFETLSGGHFGEDAIFLCHVMLFPHLTLAELSQQSTAPTLTHPTPLLWRSCPRPGA